MPDLDHNIREALERVTTPADGTGSVSFEALAWRRRRRRVRRMAFGVLPVVVVLALAGLGLVFAVDRDHTTVADRGSNLVSPSVDPVTVTRTEVVGDGVGTTRVVMEFDNPLPADSVEYFEDITGVDAPETALYTTQQTRETHVCADTHVFGHTSIGTVDLIIPSEWFADGQETHTSRLDRVGQPPKFVVCGPHRGFFQYSIWGPASADPADVMVTISPDRSQLTVRIDSPPVVSADPSLNSDRNVEDPSALDDSGEMLNGLFDACARAAGFDPQGVQVVVNRAGNPVHVKTGNIVPSEVRIDCLRRIGGIPSGPLANSSAVKTFFDDRSGVGITYPTAWPFTARDLTPEAGLEFRFAISTNSISLGGGGGCAHLPVAALNNLDPAGVLIHLEERGPVASLEGQRSRPASFASELDQGVDVNTQAWQCSTNDNLGTLRWIEFHDQSRLFYLLVAIGSEAAPSLAEMTAQVLDTLTIAPQP